MPGRNRCNYGRFPAKPYKPPNLYPPEAPLCKGSCQRQLTEGLTAAVRLRRRFSVIWNSPLHNPSEPPFGGPPPFTQGRHWCSRTGATNELRTKGITDCHRSRRGHWFAMTWWGLVAAFNPFSAGKHHNLFSILSSLFSIIYSPFLNTRSCPWRSGSCAEQWAPISFRHTRSRHTAPHWAGCTPADYIPDSPGSWYTNRKPCAFLQK